jgi:hypothetical protein
MGSLHPAGPDEPDPDPPGPPDQIDPKNVDKIVTRAQSRLPAYRHPVTAFGPDKAPGATYSLPETRRHLLDGYRLGIERIWHWADLEQEPLLGVKRARDRWPDPTRLDRELARFEATARLSRWRARWAKGCSARWWPPTLGPRSTATPPWRRSTASGRARAPGPNPHQHGRPADHPWLRRERKSGLVVPSPLRPEDTGSATEATAVLRQSEARWPYSRRPTVLIRADRGCDAAALDAQGERRTDGGAEGMPRRPG